MKFGVRFALLAVACSLLVGCGGSGLPLVHVNGHVTFNGGSCPGEGRIVFTQIPGSGLAGVPNRPGRADFGTNGKFAATSFKDGDGLLPGRYRVTIVCMDGEPGPTRPYAEISYVPSDYQPEELVVEEGRGAIEVNYDVPPKKK